MIRNFENYSNLIERYGSPLYVFYEEEFIQNITKFCRIFREYYENYQMAYSYKTNYTPYICKIIKDLGGYAEVVSDMEYCLAKKIGYSNNKIIYNGPCKGKYSFEHLLNGGILNIDSKDEAIKIIDFVKKYPSKIFKIGLRINADIGANFISRFGIELDSLDFKETVQLLNSTPNLKLVGVHCHISRARGIAPWRKRMENLLYVVDKYFMTVPEFIDLGSGMFGDMDPFLSSQFDMKIPTYREYAKVTAQLMDNYFKKSLIKPILFTEPGTTVVAKYLSLITQVKYIKTIKDKNFAVVDACFYNIGDISKMKNVPYYIAREDTSIAKENRINCDVVGYTCLEQDCLFHDMNENLNKGNIIEFTNVGGYSIVSKPPFIQPNCAMISIDKNSDIKEIKRKETFNDIFQTFKF